MTPTPTRRAPGRRLAVVLALALAAALLAPAGPAVGQDGDEGGNAVEPRVVGGIPAPPGAWPSQVALLRANISNNFNAQFCGGTLLNPSWVLTAAHCLVSSNGTVTAPGAVDVLTGTQQLSSGGTRLDVAEVRIVHGYVRSTFQRDVALLRLADPSTVAHQALVAPGAAVGAGTPATATGWGTTAYGQSNRQDHLRQVIVPVVSDQQCRQAGYGASIDSSSMLCAGAPGLDTCQGDSGGPLLVPQSGTWVQIGITSWGNGCGTLPGVYSKVSAFTSWIRAQIRFGPHTNANAFVDRMYRDLFDRAPSNIEVFFGVAALNDGLAPHTYAADLLDGSAYQTRTGGVARLYRAFFQRDADLGGLRHWSRETNAGRSLTAVAEFMAGSTEFATTYGSLTDEGFVDLVYQNVLGRAPDAGGRAFWVDELTSGRRTRGAVMAGFSESAEHRATTKARVDITISYFGLLRRLPSASDHDFWTGRPLHTLAGTMLGSVEYAARF